MTSLPLDSTHGQMTSGVARHHRPWTVHTVGRRREWHDITALGQHTRSNDVGSGMPSLPEGSTHGQTTSGMTCHHRLGKAHTFNQHPAWIEITALGLHARLEDVERGMTSLPLDSTDGRQCRVWTLKVALHHRPWAAHMVELRQAWHGITALGQHTRSNDVGHDMPSPSLESTHVQTTSCVE